MFSLSWHIFGQIFILLVGQLLVLKAFKNKKKTYKMTKMQRPKGDFEVKTYGDSE